MRGEEELLRACRHCYASLFTDRAISYRTIQGFDHLAVALSVGVQLMVRSDIGGSGVMFSLDTESGFDKVVLINAAWGLGENVVQGAVDPDEYQVYKPFLSRPGITPILKKALGGKEIKMIYGGTTGANESPFSWSARTRRFWRLLRKRRGCASRRSLAWGRRFRATSRAGRRYMSSSTVSWPPGTVYSPPSRRKSSG